MSNAIYPAFPALKFSVNKTLIAGRTLMQESISGKEFPLALWGLGSPRHQIDLTYDFVYSRQAWVAASSFPVASSNIYDTVTTDMDALRGFVMARQGMFDTFLFSDPDEDPVVQGIFGTGTGSATVFQLYDPAGGSPLVAGEVNEIVQNVNGTPAAPAGSWAASTGYGSGTKILPSNRACYTMAGRFGNAQSPGWPLMFTSGGGTSGATEPFWPSASLVGQTITDGSITWTNAGVPFVIYNNGAIVATSAYSLGSTGIVTFTSAPGNGNVLSWTGDYFYRCRFLEDSIEFEEFFSKYYAIKKLSMISVKL